MSLRITGNVKGEADLFERLDGAAPFVLDVMGSTACLILRGQGSTGMTIKVTAVGDPLKPGPDGHDLLLEVT